MKWTVANLPFFCKSGRPEIAAKLQKQLSDQLLEDLNKGFKIVRLLCFFIPMINST